MDKASVLEILIVCLCYVVEVFDDWFPYRALEESHRHRHCRRAFTSTSQHTATATSPAANKNEENLEKLHLIYSYENEEISVAVHISSHTLLPNPILFTTMLNIVLDIAQT